MTPLLRDKISDFCLRPQKSTPMKASPSRRMMVADVFPDGGGLRVPRNVAVRRWSCVSGVRLDVECLITGSDLRDGIF